MDQIELKILLSSIALETTTLKVKSSLEDIESKHPGRKDLIKSMSETLNDLELIRTSFVYLRQKYDVGELINYNHTDQIQTLKTKNESLKTELENIKKNLNL